MARTRQAITIRHVAADAGVSHQTVSRVINRDPNVRPETMERVQASIEKLGYVPSIAARLMGGSKSHLILALNDRDRTIADWRDQEGTDWVDQMLLGGMLTCAEHGYRFLIELIDTHSDHIERELSATIAAVQPDGVVLTPPHSHNPVILDLLRDWGISFARIGSRMDGPGFTLTMGDEGAARLATRHLLDLGHRRIGLIAGPDSYEVSGWRVEGWRAAMTEGGAKPDGLLATGDFSFASGKVAAAELLDSASPPTAIIASNDQMALATLELCRERGVRVPEQLSLVSFDDTPIVRFAHPPLTAICQPIAAVFSRAVELIIAERRGKAHPGATTTIEAALIPRASTSAPRLA
jgi:LacI family transcriptional regulator